MGPYRTIGDNSGPYRTILDYTGPYRDNLRFDLFPDHVDHFGLSRQWGVAGDVALQAVSECPGAARLVLGKLWAFLINNKNVYPLMATSQHYLSVNILLFKSIQCNGEKIQFRSLLYDLEKMGLWTKINFCQNPTKVKSSQLKATLKHLALELAIVVTWNPPPRPS